LKDPDLDPAAMIRTRLFLVRHAEVEGRYHRVFGGRIDMDLSPWGHEQAASLAAFFRPRPLDALYASPMKRVQQTLHPLRPHARQPPVLLPDLREVDFGDWTGLSWEEVAAKYQTNAFDWLRQLELSAIANAECPRAWRTRVAASLDRILKAHPGQEVGVVCHGGVIRMLLSILLELPLGTLSGFEIEYASVTCVDFHPRKAVVQWLNFTPWRDPIQP
jgi:broad specificity phosphatase PhoE